MFISLAATIVSTLIVGICDAVTSKYNIDNEYIQYLTNILCFVILVSLSLFLHCYSSSNIAFITDVVALILIIKYILGKTNEMFRKCLCSHIKIKRKLSLIPGLTIYFLGVNDSQAACPMGPLSILISSSMLLYYFVNKMSIASLPSRFCYLRHVFNLCCRFFVAFSILFGIIWAIDYSYLQCQKNVIIDLVPKDHEMNLTSIQSLGYYITQPISNALVPKAPVP